MQTINSEFLWEDFNVKKIEARHDLTDQAKRDGQTDIPKTNSDFFSVIENEIIGECNTYLDKHRYKLENFLQSVEKEQNKLSSHLKNNHFDSITSRLSADFNTLANEKKIKLSDYKNSYDKYLEEQNSFKRFNQLSREPNAANWISTIVSLSIIILLTGIEVFLNMKLLTGAMVGGQDEAMYLAASAAAVNVLMSVGMGFFIVKRVNHIKKFDKNSLFSFNGILFFSNNLC